MQNNDKFKLTFRDIGHEWRVTEELFEIIHKFTCKLYCWNTSISKIKMLRYKMFDVVSGQLPQFEDALRQDTYRANYQWRDVIKKKLTIPSPIDRNGWNLIDGKIEITWYTHGAAAPYVVLGLLVCKCSCSCGNNCTSVSNSSQFTPTYKLQNCSI